MHARRLIKATLATIAAAGIVATGTGVATAEMSDPPACELDGVTGGCLTGPIGMNGGAGTVPAPSGPIDDPTPSSGSDATASVVGPNYDDPEAYQNIGFAEAPDGTHTSDARGIPYSTEQGQAIDVAVTDAAIRGAFGQYTTATWVPYNSEFGSFRDWFSVVLDWFPSCIDYSGAKATGGLPIPDGALCFSGWRP